MVSGALLALFWALIAMLGALSGFVFVMAWGRANG